MAWNLHIIGHDALAEVQTIVNKLAKDLQGAGHVLDSAVLTSSEGIKHIAPIIESAANVAGDVDPALKPATGIVDEVVNEAEKLAEDVKERLDPSSATAQPNPPAPANP